jgi:hypothetical protein
VRGNRTLLPLLVFLLGLLAVILALALTHYMGGCCA